MEEEQAADRCSTTGSADLLSVVVLLSSVVVLLSLVFVVEMTKNEQAGRRGWGLTLSFRLLFCFFFLEGRKKQKKVESVVVVVVQRMPFSPFWPGFHNRCLRGEKEEQNKKTHHGSTGRHTVVSRVNTANSFWYFWLRASTRYPPLVL